MRGIAVLGLAGLAAGWWAADWGGRTAWFLSGTLAALLAYALFVAASVRFRGFQVERSWGNRSALQAGEALKASFRVKLALPVPGVWLLIEESWRHEGTGETVTVTACGPAGLLGSAMLAGQSEPLPRGPYQAVGRLITAGDAFGLLRVKRRQTPEGRLLALPRCSSPPAAPGAADETARRSKRSAQALAAAEPLQLGTRPYAPGDPLSRIHWRSSARTGELRAKELELPAAGRQLICLDAAGAGSGAAGAGGSGGPALAALWAEPALAAAVEAAAGLARRALERGHGVRLAVADGRAGALEAPPHGRLAHLLAALAAVPQALPRPEAFAELVAREAFAAGGAGVTAVTARPDPGLVTALRRLKRGAVHVICVHGPWQRGGEAALKAWQRELEALGCAVTVVPVAKHGQPQGGDAHAAI
ncbi:DUF58 domain-containing protein [Paenibacillus puerhi]|uniref:DUF58 domain-containing protein n=1 Tax=Paenibacillus puerhi TaxID=2692622 RepID=UPI00135A0D2A|nr:DUF58 domain-containing protein [Paenibacillus puerhi]